MSSWFKPTSDDAEPGWMPKDTVRSTIELIETCILTLVLCAWTAIHLDIPAKADRPETVRKIIQGTLNRGGWTIIGILMPEYILWIAIAEFWEATTICKELKTPKTEEGGVVRSRGMGEGPAFTFTVSTESAPSTPVDNQSSKGSQHRSTFKEITLNGNDEIHPIPDEKHSKIHFEEIPGRTAPLPPDENVTITLVHGFYIEMGGLEIVPVHGLLPEKIPSRLQKYLGRVTSQGAIALYREGEIPEMPPKERINDRSKSDFLTKVITCTQASWMIVQCIGRHLNGLPLTLLEVNTVMHVMCALIQYALWFFKPQDVKYPTLIKVDIERLERFEKLVEKQPIQKISEVNAKTSRTDPDSFLKIMTDIVAGLRSKTKTKPEKFRLTEASDQSNAVQLGSCRTAKFHEAVLIGAGVGLVTSSIYGAVHLTMWRDHFPTRLERAVWRISGCIIVGMPFFLVIFLLSIYVVRFLARGRGVGGWTYNNGSWEYHHTGTTTRPDPVASTFSDTGESTEPTESTNQVESTNRLAPPVQGIRRHVSDLGIGAKNFWARFRGRTEGRIDPKTSTMKSLWDLHLQFLKDLKRQDKWDWFFCYSIFIILQGIASFCYIMARTFLVIEAFASLRSLPKGAYTTLNWVELFPHM